MKLNKLFMGLLGALAMTACSSDDIVPEAPRPIEGDGEPRYMSVTIRNSNGGLTRAEGDQNDVTNPDNNADSGNGKYEEGYGAENEVKSLRFYFFDGAGEPIAISTGSMGRSYYDCLDEDIDSDNTSSDPAHTVEKILNAVIVINSTNKDIATKIKYMAAVANYKTENRVINTGLDANLSLKQFTELVFSEEAINSADGFLLTSSSYVKDRKAVFAVDVAESDIKGSREEAKNAPVDIYVERVHAKVRVKTDWATDFVGKAGIIRNVKLEGDKTEYDAIPLYSFKQGADGKRETKPITVDDKEGSDQVYVIFTGWNIWSNADQSYVIKNVNPDWLASTSLGDWWNSSYFHRSFWAKNPKNTKLIHHPHNYATKKVLTSGVYKDQDLEAYNAYCLENAGDDYDNETSGIKLPYTPETQVTNRTLAYIAGMLVTVNGTAAKELELVEWAATKGTEAAIKTRMFKTVENLYYFLKKDSETSTTVDEKGNTIITSTSNESWTALRVEDVKFETGTNSNMADDKSENSPRYRSFLQLNFKEIPAQYDGKIYEKVSEGKYREVKLNDGETYISHVNKKLTEIGGAKFWQSGKTYYYNDIAHLNTLDNDGTKGKFGVVRNHIYEIQINSVFGLGTPVLNPKDDQGSDYWETIIPQKPENEFYLGARLNILSWRVVNNNVNFEW